MTLIVDDRGKRVLTNEITYKNVIVRHMSSYSPVVSHDRRQHVKPGAPFASYRSFIASKPMLRIFRITCMSTFYRNDRD